MFSFFDRSRSARKELEHQIKRDMEYFKSRKKELHGHDLDEFEFLGTAELNFVEGPVEGPHKILRSAEAFFFCKKGNHDQRSYVICPLGGYVDDRYSNNFFRDHSYGVKHLPLWKIGEYEWFQLIQEPSNYTRDTMLKLFGVVWNNKSRKWEHTHGQKKEAFKDKKPKIEGQENNVVKVDFNKDKDEEK